MIKITDIMNHQPIVIGCNAKLLDAIWRLAETRCSDLMVLSDDGEWLGVLSEGDILRSLLPSFDSIQGSLIGGGDKIEINSLELENRSVSELLIKDAFCVGPNEGVLRAAAIMASMNIRRLPVVDSGVLLGTIGREDLCLGLIRD